MRFLLAGERFLLLAGDRERFLLLAGERFLLFGDAFLPGLLLLGLFDLDRLLLRLLLLPGESFARTSTLLGAPGDGLRFAVTITLVGLPGDGILSICSLSCDEV